jgi:hypothetical protein
MEYVRGKGSGRPRPGMRSAAKRAAGIGGVDAADFVLRSGRVARRAVFVVFVDVRCGAIAEDEPSSTGSSSPAGPGAESTEV